MFVAGVARNDCSSELAACKARIDAGDISWQHGLHDAVSGLLFLALVVAQLVLARGNHSRVAAPNVHVRLARNIPTVTGPAAATYTTSPGASVASRSADTSATVAPRPATCTAT